MINKSFTGESDQLGNKTLRFLETGNTVVTATRHLRSRCWRSKMGRYIASWEIDDTSSNCYDRQRLRESQIQPLDPTDFMAPILY